MEYKSLTTPAATGGTVTEIDGYRIHAFTSSGTFTVNKSMNVEYLVVAGGGGGLGSTGGGGGAGGMLEGTNYPVTPQAYAITVGIGGIGGYSPTNGENSVFDTITAIGGGSGLNGTGGSGGGGRYSLIPGGTGTPGQGNNGGNGRTGAGGQNSGNGYNAGGGGGKNVVGGNAISSKSGDGGAGKVSSITGTAVTYAGGGGGGADAYRLCDPGIGGVGGGGNGGYFSAGTAGTANTGGGGGGGSNSATITWVGGAGGSGIVIIRYLLSEDLTPANITATNMTITPSISPCIEGSCTVTVDVTWTNTGETSGSFTPSIKIDTIPIVVLPPLTPVSVGPSLTASQQFIITGMTTGTHTICPDPN